MSQDWRRASLVYNTQCHNMRQPSVGLLPSSQQGFAGLMCNMLVHNTHLRHAADLFPRPVRLSLRTGCGPRFVIAHHWLEQSSFSFRVRDSQESVCSLTAFSSRETQQFQKGRIPSPTCLNHRLWRNNMLQLHNTDSVADSQSRAPCDPLQNGSSRVTSA